MEAFGWHRCACRGALVVFLPHVFYANLFSLTSDQKIRDLCAKVSSFPEKSEQFWQALAELRDALAQHTIRLRENIASQSKKSKTKVPKAS